MKIQKILQLLDAKLVVKSESTDDLEIEYACGSDLMSDVMAFVTDNVLLLTGLVTPQVIRTAEMMDIRSIVFVRGKQPTEAIIALAEDRGITVMSTHHPMFAACGILYSNGVRGKGE